MHVMTYIHTKVYIAITIIDVIKLEQSQKVCSQLIKALNSILIH